MEIERKYLVNTSRWEGITKNPGEHIIQGYLHISPEKTIRVRIRNSKATLTVKGKSKGIAREEIEFSIPLVQAQQLLTQFCKHKVEKIRYTIPYKGKNWEIDSFLDENSGLIIAEIELESENEQIIPPQWVDREVSNDIRYYNAYLAEHPYKTWST